MWKIFLNWMDFEYVTLYNQNKKQNHDTYTAISIAHNVAHFVAFNLNETRKHLFI